MANILLPHVSFSTYIRDRIDRTYSSCGAAFALIGPDIGRIAIIIAGAELAWVPGLLRELGVRDASESQRQCAKQGESERFDLLGIGHRQGFDDTFSNAH